MAAMAIVDVNQNNQINELEKKVYDLSVEAKYGTLPSPSNTFHDDPRLRDEKKIMSLSQ